MATFSVNCPHCGGTLEVQDEWAGMETACPLCSKAFIVPRRSIPAAPPTPRAAVPQPVSQPPAGGYFQVGQPASGPEELPKLYNPNSAGLLSIFLTPIFGSWCVWKNYKTLGDDARAVRSLIWTFCLAVIILSAVFFADWRWSKFIKWGNIALLLIWYFVEQKPQNDMLKMRAKALGIPKAYESESCLVPALIAIAVIIVLSFLWAYVCTGGFGHPVKSEFFERYF